MKTAKRHARRPGRTDARPLRLIGGRWRGRKLPVPEVEGLRPTGDRVRETLFNWLAPFLPGARCLDLFAGTGALGLEALSRGAEHVRLLERDPAAIACLRENLQRLAAEGARLERAEALEWLRRAGPEPFDVVFIDPPFAADLWQQSIDRLAEGGWLAPDAAVYVESGPEIELTPPADWYLHRDKTSGKVRYRLYFVGR